LAKGDDGFEETGTKECGEEVLAVDYVRVVHYLSQSCNVGRYIE